MTEEAKQKDDRIDLLEALKENLGWKIVVKAIEEDITIIDSKLHGVMRIEADETMQQLQENWRLMFQLKAYPDFLIDKFKDTPEPKNTNLDPFA